MFRYFPDDHCPVPPSEWYIGSSSYDQPGPCYPERRAGLTCGFSTISDQNGHSGDIGYSPSRRYRVPADRSEFDVSPPSRGYRVPCDREESDVSPPPMSIDSTYLSSISPSPRHDCKCRSWAYNVESCSGRLARHTDAYIVGPQTSYEHPILSGRHRPTRADDIPQGDTNKEDTNTWKRRKPTSEEPNHECTICGKIFRRSYDYKFHMDWHNTKRAYSCTAMVGNQQCSESFSAKSHLEKHLNSVR